MALPAKVLEKILPKLSVSRITVEGDKENVSISTEIEVLQSSRTPKNIREKIKTRFLFLETDGNTPTLESLQQKFQDSEEEQDFSEDSEKLIEEDGTQYISKTQTFFEKRHVNKKKLIIYYGSFIEDEEIKQYGKVKAEIIFENGEIKSESSIYFLQGTQEAWTGGIILSEDRLTYTTDEAIPRQLERYVTKNYKIQDFRIKKSIEKKIADFQQINNDLANANSRNIIKDRPSKVRYFTDAFISQKENTSVIFGINFRQLILDNSIFGHQSKMSDIWKQQIVDRSEILDMKIVKRKVEYGNRNNHPLTDENHNLQKTRGSEEVVAQSRDSKSGLIANDRIKEIKNVVAELSEKTRLFHCTDRNSQQKAESTYQYGVEIEVLDGSSIIIYEDIKKIRKQIKDLTEIFNELVAFINTNSGSLYTEAEINGYINDYLVIMNKYFLVGESVAPYYYSLSAQLSPVNLPADALLNFINLQEKLLSNLNKFLSIEEILGDDPHIEDKIRENKGRKSILIKKYFDNDVSKTGRTLLKNVEYLPISNNILFNEFEFGDLSFGSRIQVQRDESGKPKTTRIIPRSVYSKDAHKERGKVTRKQFGDSEEQKKKLDKTIRQNLLSHINISITKNILNPTGEDTEPSRDQRTDQYNPKVAELYKYFSLTNTENKIIDEVFELYDKEKTEFFCKIDFLSDFDEHKTIEKWKDLALLDTTRCLDTDGHILCKLNILKHDKRETKWEISDNMFIKDTYFLLHVKSYVDLQQGYTKLFATEVAPSNPVEPTTVDNIGISIFAENNFSDQILIQNNVTKEQIKNKANQIRKQTSNAIVKRNIDVGLG